ncbi:MAG: hypothetical protein HGB18_03445 [Candidatus Moranbacteria bacterium]|nr:hypothetical protein [Candidatus Moranbacteria bacterium]
MDEKEAALYLAALNLGEAGMSELAAEAGLKRGTAYLIFESLERKGLMGSFRMRSGLRFVATEPEAILSGAEHRLNELRGIMPELIALSKKDEDEPRVTFYRGEAGYIAAIGDSLRKPGSVLRHVGSITEAHLVYGDYDTSVYVPERIRKNISIRCLYTADTSRAIRERDHVSERREIKYLPAGYPLKTAMLIYDGHVVITGAAKELVTVVIESPALAESERLRFDLLWSLLP